MMNSSAALVPGTRVVAKLEGWGKHYPGMINRKHADGSFDIVFDDGDRASHVQASSILPADTARTQEKTMGAAQTNAPPDSRKFAR